MSADPFDVVDAKREEASHCLRRLGKVYIRPEHTGQATSYMIAAMSCPNTIVAHQWHNQFKTLLHGFLAATRSIPDIIESRFGYDDKAADRKAWIKSLDPGEQQRRKDFSMALKPDFNAFKGHALSAQRRKAIHFDGQADWHVEVVGFRGQTYFGDNTAPLDQAEEQVFTGDPALDVPAMSSPALHLQPRAENFWLGSKGDANRTPLFDECRRYLSEADCLIRTARSLFASIHDGHPFTVPTW
jgi:hypothetical protein